MIGYASSELKILSIGNSFSVDTMEHMANIAKSVGVGKFKFGNLYIGGCSINRHFHNAKNNAADYRYYVNTGLGWTETMDYTIYDAVKEENWDFISIQHGTGDGSRYTLPESYENLLPLIRYVKDIAHKDAKIAFNMAWVAEPECTHPEIVYYCGNQLLMYEKLTQLTEKLILPIEEIDVVSPTGTAIQNARTCIAKKLTRDDFHLSYELGRYIAGLTFFKALCDLDIDKVKWSPDGVSAFERTVAKMAADAALENPFSITKINVGEYSK